MTRRPRPTEADLVAHDRKHAERSGRAAERRGEQQRANLLLGWAAQLAEYEKQLREREANS